MSMCLCPYPSCKESDPLKGDLKIHEGQHCGQCTGTSPELQSGRPTTFLHLHPGQCYHDHLSPILPVVFQCCGDKQWGDWRPHLAVILSNQGGDLELHQRAIITMGDTLGKQKPAQLPSSPLGHLQASFKHLSRSFKALCRACLGLCSPCLGNSRERSIFLASPFPNIFAAGQCRPGP